MRKKYHVHLSDEQRLHLRALIRAGHAPARSLAHARILIKADADGPAHPDHVIAAALECSLLTVLRTRRRFCQHGLDAALHRKPAQRTYTRRLDGRAEAHLVALSCGPAPEGHARWTLRLLSKRMVELSVVESVSYETVRGVLKKTNSSRGVSNSG